MIEKIELRTLFDTYVSNDYVKWLNDPEINKYLEIRHKVPITKSDIVDFISNCKKIQRHHWGIFVNNNHVGNISCSDKSPIYKWIDISIVVGNKTCWGNGVGRMALSGAINYLINNIGFHRIQAGVYANNTASIKLFQRLGFLEEGIIRESVIFENDFIDVIKFGLIDREWIETNEFLNVHVHKMPWE